MKTTPLFVTLAVLVLLTASCSAFGPKYGCPSNGRNVGAEKLLSDPKAARKAKKFRA